MKLTSFMEIYLLEEVFIHKFHNSCINMSVSHVPCGHNLSMATVIFLLLFLFIWNGFLMRGVALSCTLMYIKSSDALCFLLQVFPQAMYYNRLTGAFEEVQTGEDCGRSSIFDSGLPYGITDDERDAMLNWARKERLPLFLRWQATRLWLSP